jgi:4,5-dihydroxyphthalate decarboxylase
VSAVPLTFACALYDRMVPLYAGLVKPEGIELTFLVSEDHRDTFDRMGRNQEFDASEMSGTEYIARLAAGSSPIAAIPVFPSRVFGHGFIYVNRRAGIRSAKDVQGKRVGVPIYSMSTALWIRGMMHDEFGVDWSTVSWLEGSVEKPGSYGNPTLPSTMQVPRIDVNHSDRSLWELLVAGDIDVLIAPTTPSRFGDTDMVHRLFENHTELEIDYFRRTRIFPIMHVVALRRSTYEANPFIAKNLCRALERSKQLSYEWLAGVGAPRAGFPLIDTYWEETKRVFGADPWPYGVEANRQTLETWLRYIYQDGVTSRQLDIEELFVS